MASKAAAIEQRANGEDDAGSAMEDGSHHLDLPAVHLQVR